MNDTDPEDWIDVMPAIPVDLADPQCFGYALRDLFRGRPIQPGNRLWGAILWRWARGETTGADRLTLARAHREVSPMTATCHTPDCLTCAEETT